MIFLIMILILISSVGKIETKSASDQNSINPFLRNEFSKIFKDLLKMTLIFDDR